MLFQSPNREQKTQSTLAARFSLRGQDGLCIPPLPDAQGRGSAPAAIAALPVHTLGKGSRANFRGSAPPPPPKCPTRSKVARTWQSPKATTRATFRPPQRADGAMPAPYPSHSGTNSGHCHWLPTGHAAVGRSPTTRTAPGRCNFSRPASPRRKASRGITFG